MKRREFFKAGGSLAGLGMFSGGTNALVPADSGVHASIFNNATANTILSCPVSDIKILGLGGFGSRMVSRLAYDVQPWFEGSNSTPTFFALDSDTDTTQYPGAISPSSLVVLMAGMGGDTGTTLIHELAQKVRQTGALTVTVVTIPEGDPPSVHNLMRLYEVSDVVFARNSAAQTPASNTAYSIGERARSLLAAENWMLRCVGGLVQAVATSSRTTLGIGELRALFSDAKMAVHGSAAGRDGQEIGASGKVAIQQALACRGMDAGKNIRAALVVCSGPAAQLRWPNIQAGQDQICNFLGSNTSCLLGVQGNEFSGYSRVRTDVWLAFS